MIRINLLPVEKRKAERTPLPRLTLIMATAAVATVLIIWVATILLRIKATDEEITNKTNELNSLKPSVAMFEKLTADKAALEAKVREIKDLTNRSMREGWWKTVNSVWDVINAHPRVWIDDLRMLDERTVQNSVKSADQDDKTFPPYGMALRCHVAGDEVAEMTKFRGALKDNAYLKQWLTFVNINVDWKVDEEREFDSNSISFTVTMWGPTKPIEPKKPGPPPKTPATVSSTPPGPAAPPGGAH